jgi:membrane protease YdiL (CAAX protease family)
MYTPFELFGLVLNLSIILTFSPLLFGVIVNHYLGEKSVFALIGLSITLGITFNLLNPIALPTILLLCGACYLFKHKQNHLKTIATLGIFIIAVSLLLHLAPGFNNPLVMDSIQVSPNASAYSKHLNLDKLLLGLLLLYFIVQTAKSFSLTNGLKVTLIFMLCAGISFSVGLKTGLIDYHLKFPVIFFGWALSNLFFTCLVEEVFFRGFVQQQLQNISTKSYWQPTSVVISGVLFGLAHFPAGIIYTSIASIMGCCYAYCYYKTRNIYATILVHFVFNLIHFCFFTYPFNSSF